MSDQFPAPIDSMIEEQPIQIAVKLYARHRMRMEMIRVMMCMDHPELGPPTQSDVIGWILDTAPIPELLRERMQLDPGKIPTGVIDARFDTEKVVAVAGDTDNLDRDAVQRAGAAAFGCGKPAPAVDGEQADVPDKPRPKRRGRGSACEQGNGRKRRNRP